VDCDGKGSIIRYAWLRICCRVSCTMAGNYVCCSVVYGCSNKDSFAAATTLALAFMYVLYYFEFPDHALTLYTKDTYSAMIKYIIFTLLIVGTLSTTQTKTAADECSLAREAILLHNIKELDFVAGQFTASRRVAAIPQVFPYTTLLSNQILCYCSTLLPIYSLLTLPSVGMHWWISAWIQRTR
jgi:hypothetical protein